MLHFSLSLECKYPGLVGVGLVGGGMVGSGMFGGGVGSNGVSCVCGGFKYQSTTHHHSQ